MVKKYYLNTKKLNEKEIFSRKMTKELFEIIIEPLNKINEVKYDKKQWYIIIFPWVALFAQNFVHYDTLFRGIKKI